MARRLLGLARGCPPRAIARRAFGTARMRGAQQIPRRVCRSSPRFSLARALARRCSGRAAPPTVRNDEGCRGSSALCPRSSIAGAASAVKR
eukprot:8394112-Pyramimonas_sp.AAC.1